MWIQHRTLPLPRLSCLGAVYTLTHTHLLCHFVWGTVDSLLSSGLAYTGGGLSSVDLFLCDLSPSNPHWLVDSSILWNS